MFLPQQHQRHAFAAQLLVQAAIVRLHMVAWSFWRNQQAPLQRPFVNPLDSRPFQTCRGGQTQVLGDSSLRHTQCGGDLPVR